MVFKCSISFWRLFGRIPIHGHIAHRDIPLVTRALLHGERLRAEFAGYFTGIFNFDGIVGQDIAVDVAEDGEGGGGDVAVNRSGFADDDATGIFDISYQGSFYPYGPCVFNASVNNAVATNKRRGYMFGVILVFFVDQF